LIEGGKTMTLKDKYQITKAEKRKLAEEINKKIVAACTIHAMKRSLHAVDRLVMANFDNNSGSLDVGAPFVNISVRDTKKMLEQIRKTKII
jgi:hypothetical protein